MLFGKLIEFMKLFNVSNVVERKVGYKNLAKLLSFLLNPMVRVFYWSRKRKTGEDVKIVEIVEFDDRINALWKRTSASFNNIVVRNKEYLNWRCAKRPGVDLKILLAEEDNKVLGFLVFASRDRKGFIVDLLVDPERPEAAQKLVSTAEQRLREDGVHRIVCWLSKNNVYQDLFETNGFKTTFTKEHYFVVGVRLPIERLPSKIPLESLGNPDHWHLTMGDTDGIFPLER
jgi:ribosomal protein S18 acetylase RimI-like enzyme